MEKNILALDLGKGSLGVAISRSGLFVTPLNNIRFHLLDFDEAILKLKKEINDETVEHIVLGLPLYPSGDISPMGEIVLAFKKKLENIFLGINIILLDESNSTLTASEILHNNGKSAKKQKKNIDSIAASVILIRYLKKIGQY